MFYAILPAVPAVFLVQPNSAELGDTALVQLLVDVGQHFMSPVALVWWDADGRFQALGHPCTEEQASGDGLQWREFALPTKSDDLPF